VHCNKCNSSDFPDGSLFCNNCGASLSTPSLKQPRSKKKWGLLSIVVGGIIVLITAFYLFNSSPTSAFEKAITSNNYGEAIEIFNKKIKGNLDREIKVESFLQASIDTVVQEFTNDKIDYNFSITKLETIKKTELLKSKVNETLSTIKELHKSRTAFKTGQEHLKNKNIKEALSELKKVTELDHVNFPKAQELVRSTSSDYKDIVINDAENLVKTQKFVEAIKVMDDTLLLLKDDSDLLAKKTSYQKQNEAYLELKRKKKIEDLKGKQELTVTGTSTFTDWLDDVHVSIIVKNTTNKVVKKFVVGWMGYDKDGFPVQTGWITPEFLKEGNAEANIQPNKSYGSGYGWKLTGGFSKTMNAATFIACVKEVEYYDGTKWENEYYSYWVEEHKEKPLK